MKKEYSELLRDPRWQKKRLEILSRDNFTCCDCKATTQTLHVHHRYYVSGRLPWEYPPFCFQTLCDVCHDGISEVADERRENGHFVFEEWEIGLDHFEEKLFDMAADGEIALR